MPNWVKTKIYAPRDVLDDILKNYTTKNDEFLYLDFEKIIPRPRYIYDGDLSTEDEKKYGYDNCWYGRQIKNWGTKWNSFELEDYEDHIEIQTAWNTPLPIIKELAMIYNGTQFLIKYADEDIGNNCGMFFIKERDIEYKKPFTDDEVFATMIWENCSEKEAIDIIDSRDDED